MRLFIIRYLRHRLNPLHIMCRLVDLGFDMARAKYYSMTYGRWYDKVAYWG